MSQSVAAAQVMMQVFVGAEPAPPPPPAARSWAESALPWFQIAAVVFTAVAAAASWRSATASLQSAARADETSRRAAEALSRATVPALRVEVHHREVPEDPTAARLWLSVLNLAEASGSITNAYVERSDGVRVATTRLMPVPITSSAAPGGYLVSLDTGNIRRFAAPADGKTGDSAHVITASVEYKDASGLMTWRQSSIYRERWREFSNPSDSEGGLIVAYAVEHEAWCEPVIASGPAEPTARPAGWLRRFVRWIW